MIVMDDADLDLALEGALWGAFGTTGQRCTATCRLILHKKDPRQVARDALRRGEELKLGDGRKRRTDVGPLINETARDKVERYVEIGEERRRLAGNRRVGAARHRLAKGWFFEPTIFAGVKPGSRLEQEEIFGPVLSVIRVNESPKRSGEQRRALRAFQQSTPGTWKRHSAR